MPRKKKTTTAAAPVTTDIALARREAAELLGFDPDRLTASDRLKCELVAALRSAVDDELMNVTSARSVDLAKLITAVETLTRFLADAAPKESERGAIFKQDPRKVLEDMVRRWHAADEASRADQGLSPRIHDMESAQARIDALEAENAELRAVLPAADPALLLAPERAIDVPTSAILPPSEQADRPENQRYRHGGQDNPKVPVTIDHEGKPLRPGSQMLPDGRIVPIPPKALSGDETKRRMAKSNSDRAALHRGMTAPSRVSGEPQPSSPMTTYGDSGFIWGGDKGRAW